MPSRWATASATACASPVIIATRTPSRWSVGDRLRGLGSDLVLEPRAVRTTRPSTTTWRTVRPSRSQAVGAAASGSRPSSREQCGSADGDRSTVDHGPGATAGQRLEAGRRGHRQMPAPRAAATIARRQRVLGVRLDRGGQRQDVVLGRRRRPPRCRRRTGSPRVSVPVLSKITCRRRGHARARGGPSRAARCGHRAPSRSR